MKEQHDYAKELGEVLDAGISIMTELYACQKGMYESVLMRDWVSLQRETSLKEEIEKRMERNESGRRRLVRLVAPDLAEGADFYRVSARFEDRARFDINAKFRELKRLVLLSKTENEIFESYLGHAHALLKGLIEAVVPSKRNKIYGRTGSLMSGPVESLVLNRSF